MQKADPGTGTSRRSHLLRRITPLCFQLPSASWPSRAFPNNTRSLHVDGGLLKLFCKKTSFLDLTLPCAIPQRGMLARIQKDSKWRCNRQTGNARQKQSKQNRSYKPEAEEIPDLWHLPGAHS